jgi:hypothetical protein
MSISIFLSYPPPINASQQSFIDKIIEWLSSNNLLARIPRITDHSYEHRLELHRALVADTNGLLCIAFRQIHVSNGERHVRAGQKYVARKLEEEWLTDPWVQIMPGMAYQMGLPVLILKEHGVVEEGILEKGVVGKYMPEFDLEDQGENEYLESKEWVQISRQWEGHVLCNFENKRRAPKLY